jgi:tetratricopeptide (TPR) repeat protein
MFFILALCFVPDLQAQDRQSVDSLPPLQEREFRTRIIHDPHNAALHYELGIKYAGANMLHQAAESFRQATIIKPDWAEAHFRLGIIFNLLSHYRDAERALRRAILLNPNYTEAYHKLGLVHINLGQYPEAAEALKQAILLDPGWAERLYHLHSPNNVEPELGRRGAMREIALILYPKDPRIARMIWKRWERLRTGAEIWPKFKEAPAREPLSPPGLKPQKVYEP